MNKSAKKKYREEMMLAELSRREKKRISASPLTHDQLLSLLENVAQSIMENGHSHDFLLTSIWLQNQTVDPQSVLSFLEMLDIKDDWDVLMKADPFILFGASSTRLSWMPLEKNDLEKLINWLEEKLPVTGCKHGYQLTEEWLNTKNFNKLLVLGAFTSKGGGCDCEIIYNIDIDSIYPTKKDSTNKDTFPSQKNQKGNLKETTQNICLNSGLRLEKIPKPWKIQTNSNAKGEQSVKFGKKDDFVISFCNFSIPVSAVGDDKKWTECWSNIVELNLKEDAVVERETISIANETYQQIIVSTPSWTPVYCWVFNEKSGNEHIRVKTSLSRKRNDLKELGVLFKYLK